MRIRKWIAVTAIASIAFWTPSVVPVKANFGCAFNGYQPADTAYATPTPCLVGGVGHGPSPWPVVVVFAGVVSVMTNAAWIWRTQCRELSSQEAMTSAFLPFIGMAFDAQASKCR